MLCLARSVDYPIMDDCRAGVVSTDHWPKRACLLTAVTEPLVWRQRRRLALLCFGRFRTAPLGSHPMRLHRPLIAALLADGVEFGPCPAWGRRGRLRLAPSRRQDKDNDTASAFVVKPYLQLGDAPRAGVSGDLVLLWHAETRKRTGRSNTSPAPTRPGAMPDAPTMRRIAVPTIATHRVYRAALNDLAAGATFAYRVRKGGEAVFSADGHAPKGAGQPYRFVVFGDCGAGTPEQKAIAYQTYLARPDFVMITGDIVYSRGQISEYRAKFWPFYNAEEASPLLGAPLLRSTLFVAAPGNHDIATRDLEKYPDGLAYFLYWDQPRNGPLGTEGSVLVPALKGSVANREAFLAAAGGAYPGWRTSLSTTAMPTGRSSIRTLTSTGPIASSGRGSSVTWLPPETPPGGSSPSTTPVSTRPRRTSTTSRCACWPMFSKKAA